MQTISRGHGDKPFACSPSKGQQSKKLVKASPSSAVSFSLIWHSQTAESSQPNDSGEQWRWRRVGIGIWTVPARVSRRRSR